MLSGELHNRSLRELMRTVPPRQLVPFWGAIFFTFAIVGFSVDVFQRGRRLLPMLVFVVISLGLLGVATVYWEINQRRRLVVVAAFANVLLLSILKRVFPLQEAPDPRRLTLDASGMLASVIVAFWLFFNFIGGTVARYLRAQAEIALARDIHRVLVPVVTAAHGEYEFFGFSEPSGDVGGDLVDVVGGDAGWVGYVADVSGHGVGAGVVNTSAEAIVNRMRCTSYGVACCIPDARLHRIRRTIERQASQRYFFRPVPRRLTMRNARGGFSRYAAEARRTSSDSKTAARADAMRGKRGHSTPSDRRKTL